MPTRKQRRRAAKEKRHEYETVWVDAEGNELEEPPEGADLAPERLEARNGKAAAKPAQKAGNQRGGRGGRVPSPPSWRRAGRRALMLGAVVFALFYLTGGKSGSNRVIGAFLLAAVYTLLFIPFTFAIDRFAYQRWQRRQPGAGGGKQSAKKR
jgi:hypothetical protein